RLRVRVSPGALFVPTGVSGRCRRSGSASAPGNFGAMSSTRTSRQIVLRRRPTGMLQPADTELITTPAPEPADGEALLRVTYIGIDAAVRTWLDDKPGYLPPVGVGEVI